jgi:hypothetical protein
MPLTRFRPARTRPPTRSRAGPRARPWWRMISPRAPGCSISSSMTPDAGTPGSLRAVSVAVWEVARHRLQCHAPGRAPLGAAVEGTVHAQEMELLAQRVRFGPGVGGVHAPKYAQPALRVARLSTFEHACATSSHRRSQPRRASWTRGANDRKRRDDDGFDYSTADSGAGRQRRDRSPLVERLAARGLPVRVGSRPGTPPFGWEDRATWAASPACWYSRPCI